MMGDSTFLSCAYCWKHEDSWDTILSYRCDRCRKRVHYSCIKSSQPSVLLGDSFFSFNCQACSENGKEHFERIAMSWVDVVMLSLYNLHRTGQGLRGFFHWKSHIAHFIETHWTEIFGSHRKKTSLWQGTVAGTLSSGCPIYFESGASQVEQGFWRLDSLQPPLPQVEKKLLRTTSRARDSPVELKSGQLRSRTKESSSLAAAMQLKEKRAQTQEGKKKKQKTLKNMSDRSDRCTLPSSDQELTKVNKKTKKMKTKSVAKSSVSSTDVCGDSEETAADNTGDTTESLPAEGDIGGILMPIQMEEDSDMEIDVDIGSTAFTLAEGLDFRPTSPDISTMLNLSDNKDSWESSAVAPDMAVKEEPVFDLSVKEEPLSECESEGQSERDIEETEDVESERSVRGGEVSQSEGEESGSSGEDGDSTTQSLVSGGDSEVVERKSKTRGKKGRPRKRRRDDDTPPPSPPPRLQPISLFEEGELLKKLNDLADKDNLPSHLAQLRRKLICNQTNREYGLPVFDLQQAVNKGKEEISNMTSSLDCQFLSGLTKNVSGSLASKETRDLDRFMVQEGKKTGGSRLYTNFRQRLVGLEDHELRPFVSPYTTRLLLPFIWRNYNPATKPLKMKLLHEIVSYHHREDSSWLPPDYPPIDYCYVRPEHIPSVNALCREFFWPGIDMSECLQYPDYSCVVMYKKIVIAFAFLVPDRGYDEAYISFVFTHPEWRGAGIATFMLYHLIQTCMGKDVLLHVSVTNPAMLLYQRLGFKAEEFTRHFYHKYFPLNSRESTDAFLMRLSR